MRFILTSLIILFFVISVSAQYRYRAGQIKNGIILEVESFFTYNSASINYERNLIAVDNNSFILNLRGGFGGYQGIGGKFHENGIGIKLSLNPLFRNERNYFETNFGFTLAYGQSPITSSSDRILFIYPIVNLGYRKQKQRIFRIYVGSLGLGIGFGQRF